MKNKLFYVLRFVGILFLTFFCAFFFYELLIPVGLTLGVVSAEVAACFIITFIPLVFIYKRTNGLSDI